MVTLEYMIKGQDINIDEIPNPEIRKILTEAKNRGVVIDSEKPNPLQMISFGWHDWSKH